jgi:hypothetical protein
MEYQFKKTTLQSIYWPYSGLSLCHSAIYILTLFRFKVVPLCNLFTDLIQV